MDRIKKRRPKERRCNLQPLHSCYMYAGRFIWHDDETYCA